MIRSKDHPFDLRKTLVRHAKSHGIRSASRTFATSRNTVRTWLRRFDDGGLSGLKSRSSRPNCSPGKVKPHVEAEVLLARERSGFGAARLVVEFELPCGVSATRRILREHRLTRRPRRKHQRKNDLRAIKARYKAFERLQIDVKHLKDQPRYWPQAKSLGLPLYQYTVRDVRTGAKWISFATECASVYAEITIRRLLRHLRDCGVDLSLTVVNSDNGSEFKGNQIRDDGSHFADAVRALGAAHRFNPPSCPNANADVESSHSRIEAEFYDREDFADLDNFLDKADLYQTYWNTGRPNRSKNNLSPWDILHAIRPSLSLDVFLLKPALLDTLLPAFLHPPWVGHNVPLPPEMAPPLRRRAAAGYHQSCRVGFSPPMPLLRGRLWPTCRSILSSPGALRRASSSPSPSGR
jgi:transposase